MPTWWDRLVGSKRWGSTSIIEEPTDLQANSGFGYLGPIPPSAELHDAVFQYLDDKDNYFFGQLKNVLDYVGVAADSADAATVNKALRRLFGGNFTSLTTNVTLTADNAGLVQMDCSGGNRTHVLPAASASNAKPIFLRFYRSDTSTNTCTIQRSGADTINGLTSITIPVGANVAFVSNGVNSWRLVSASGLRQVDLWTASGTATVPWWARNVRVKVTAAGGGGGGSNGAGSGGAGGAGAGYSEGIFPVVPGATIAVTVGIGGAGGGGTPSNGATGSSSSFGSFCSATGGTGGGAAASTTVATAGTPGTGTGGHLNIIGIPGSGAYVGVGSTVIGGAGGASYAGKPTPIVSAGVPTVGSNGVFPGGGASGGILGNSGGTGASGLVEVEWLP